MTPPFVLGRNVNHDPLSRNFPAPTVVVPKTVLHTHYGAVLDQGNIGACTGNAMVDALMTAPLRIKGTVLTEADALRIYSAATYIDGDSQHYPPDDTGSDGLSVAKIAQREGRITKYVHAFGLDHGVAALPDGPAIVGINWYADMFNPDSKGFVRPTGDLQGGHEIEWLGANVKTRVCTFLNSWGSSWAKKGKFYMTFDDFSTLLSQQGDILFPIR
jgi:hypothetical protein